MLQISTFSQGHPEKRVNSRTLPCLQHILRSNLTSFASHVTEESASVKDGRKQHRSPAVKQRSAVNYHLHFINICNSSKYIIRALCMCFFFTIMSAFIGLFDWKCTDRHGISLTVGRCWSKRRKYKTAKHQR